jgi:hypothetical protein
MQNAECRMQNAECWNAECWNVGMQKMGKWLY